MRPAIKLGLATLLLPVLYACVAMVPHVYDQAFKVEHHYAQLGTATIEQKTVPDVHGRKTYELFWPTSEVGPLPAVILQNGTNADINNYQPLAKHLASWGFLVVGNYDQHMGSGETAIKALSYLDRENANADSMLYRRVAMGRIASIGSSQGAVGTLNAHTNFRAGKQFKTLVAHGLPSQDALKLFRIDLEYDTANVTAPLLILSGTEDDFISPIDLSIRYFERIRGRAERVLAIANNADHVAMAGDGSRFRGYLTAWLSYQLRQDRFAARAFTGASAEIARNTNWNNVRMR